MLSGQTIGLLERTGSNELLLEDPVAEVADEEAEISGKVLCRASFEELAKNYVQCDTIIWFLISLLLVLAWGVGAVMLLCLPARRYVLQKEISSRELYVTPTEIVYKVTRPSFLQFLGKKRMETRIPLQHIIDVIVEQGCLQSMFGIHTFRIENIARGKAAPINELQFQGVSNPGLLRKVIITEAARCIREVRRLKATVHPSGGGSMIRVRSQTEPHAYDVTHSPRSMVTAFPLETDRLIPSELLLTKLEEVMQSVKKIEFLIGKSKAVVSDG
ncbi:hypothetical protein AXF42_Ash007141 [Apostasia shenzhenica]|uniref:DUF7642 domain-containing protein n=1 Tax=Apostasia shenzhenica TaxID=1088818 RepID=A0A2I0BF63_9ASPA|nr:hypothetical protein AXF42_Ash007141 [Apostasia shenzhenica]